MRSRLQLNIFFLTFAVVVGFAGNVWAQCTNPTADELEREYFNGGYKVCVNTLWLDIGCTDATWASDLRRYWKFDEGTGDTIDSVDGNATTRSNVTLAPGNGYRDGAYGFNGTTSYVNAGGNTSTDLDDLGPNGGLSVSMWVYPTGLGENSNGVLIGKDNGTTGSPVAGWTVRLTGTNRVTFQHDYSTADLVRTSSNNAITLNAWNHVVVTWNGSANSSGVHIYVNGSEVSYAVNTTGTGSWQTDATSDVIIGNNRVASLTRTFAGAIDEVYIFNDIVTAGEISALRSRGCAVLETCSSAGAGTAEVEFDTASNAYLYCDGNNVLNYGCATTSSTETPEQVLGEPPTAGLLGWWRLDESGGTFADSSGNGHTGTQYNSGPTYQPNNGKINGSAFFNANDANADNTQPHITLGTTFSIPSMPYTLTAWVNPTDYNDYRSIIGQRNSFPNDQRFLWLLYTGSGDVGLLGNNSTDAYFDYTPPTNEWTHLAVVATATETTLYVNGVYEAIDGPVDLSGSTTAYTNIGDNGEIEGCGGCSSDGDPWKGYLDDVRVYSGALTASQIGSIYSYSLEHGLVAHWKLDESAGTAADSSGNNNTGTLTNGPVWRPTNGGRIRGGLEFDGLLNGHNDYVQVTGDLIGTGDASVSLWMKPESYGYGFGGAEKSGILLTNGEFTILVGDTGAEENNIAVYSDGGNSAESDANSIDTMDRWYHVVATRSATGETDVYINGTLSSWNDDHDSGTPTAGGDIYIGGDGSTDLSFDGRIDDIRIYNRVLNAGDVAALHRYAGPLGHWKLDESSGNWLDSGTQGWTGTPVNSPTHQPAGGRVNGAVQFSAVDGNADNTQPHIDLGTDFDIGGAPYTLAAWVNPTDYNDWRNIFGKRDSSSNNRFQWVLTSPSGNVRLENSNVYYDFSYIPPTGTWTHLAVISRTNGTDLYVNGALQETTGVVVGAGPATAMGAHANIGDNGGNDSSGAGADGDPFKGRIDDMRVYDRALGANEIKGIYNEGLPDNMVAYWRLDELSGTTANDSVNNFDGTVAGSPTVWIPNLGAVKGALLFDGYDDWIEVTDSGATALDRANGNPVTFSVWAYGLPDISGIFANFITKNGSGGLWNYIFQLTDTGLVEFMYQQSDGTIHRWNSTNQQVFLQQWAHYAVTYTYGTGSSIKVYVNGVEIPGSWVLGTGNAAPTTGDGSVWIGSAGSAFEMWEGILDDVRMYNAILTPAEMRTLYTQTNPGRCQYAGTCGEAGKMEYDPVVGMMKWCNGTIWLPLSRRNN